MTGYSEAYGGWRMPWAVNLHTHFRFTDEMMGIVIPEGARWYRYATAMPNFQKDRIRTAGQALAYRERALQIARRHNPTFDLTVPLYLEPDTKPETLREGFERNAFFTLKLYPRGGTTNSAEGVDFRELGRLDETLDTASQLEMKLLIHAEPQFYRDGTEIDVFEREERSLSFIDDLMRRHPRLDIVMEHISTKAAALSIEHWQHERRRINATVAPQYLVWNRNELFRGGMNPAKYSIPVLKTNEDLDWLRQFVIYNGFLGTDSAPHPVHAKSRPCNCPGGVFNDPVALIIYFQVFKESGLPDWFERFVDFACFRGPKFYGLEPDETDAILITEEPWRVPETYGSGDHTIIPMCAGEILPYRVEALIASS